MNSSWGLFVGILITVTAIMAGLEAYSIPPSIMHSTQSTTGLCVWAGEPLYPNTIKIDLQNFVKSLQGTYVVLVNETAALVTVRNPNGGGVGSSRVSVVGFPVVVC